MKLLYFSHNPHGATSFYRGIGALGKIPEIDLYFQKEINWTNFVGMDVLYLERPCDQTHLRLANMAKDMGVKVIIDFDDDLTSVPIHNPAYHSHRVAKSIMDKIIPMADIITVSTEHLQKKIPNSIVIPNSLDLELYPLPLKQKQNNLTVWRGSQTHEHDLLSDINYLLNMINKSFVFIGDPGQDIKSKAKEAQFIPQMSIERYFKFIRELKPQRFYFPLEDNEFNKSKSNIAFLEATMCGADFISNSVGPFQNIPSNWKDSCELIREKYDLKKVNKLRLELLCSIV